MINIDNKSNCCGCTACESICAHKAITMQPDALGFLYPCVDLEKCVECGLCERVCQFKNDYKRYDNYEEPKVFGLRLKDSAQLTRSQSGGAFWGIAQHFIDNDGIVYGAAFESTWRVTHQKASNKEELDKIRMSKYVQSDMRGVFKQVKDDLKQGHTVLFSGTACQVAGLKAYIPTKLHSNLSCIDIICHGVPAPKIWEDYIEYLETRYCSKIVNACFRDKRFGWHGAIESFTFENGKEIFRRTSNRLYFTGISMRESCANCKFTNLKRVSDITVGDFWGVPKDSPYEKDKKGYSLALINSAKGLALFDKVKDIFYVEESNTVDCLQPQLQHPSKLSPLHRNFAEEYKRNGFLYVARKYGDIGIRFKIKKIHKQFKTFCGKISRMLHLRK